MKFLRKVLLVTSSVLIINQGFSMDNNIEGQEASRTDRFLNTYPHINIVVPEYQARLTKNAKNELNEYLRWEAYVNSEVRKVGLSLDNMTKSEKEKWLSKTGKQIESDIKKMKSR